MDTLSTILDGHRARGASLLRCHMRAPWAMRIEDRAPVGIVVMVMGVAWLTPAVGEPIRLEAGDVAVAKGPTPYVFGDTPGTPPTIVIEPGNVCRSLTGEHLAVSMGLGTRTWGNAGPTDPGGAGAARPGGESSAAGEGTTFLSATWELESQVTGRLLDAMPPVAVVRARDLDPALCDLLGREVGRDLPGQDVLLDRLVDLVLVSAVRQWFARPGSDAPTWWTARADPVVGRALALLHDEPSSDWSLDKLAAAVRVSRATLSRRFTDLVGMPPMAYLSQWRLASAADLLRSGSSSVEQIAGQVGYSSAFAFSTAFRRQYGQSPRAFRAAASAGVSSPVGEPAPGALTTAAGDGARAAPTRS